MSEAEMREKKLLKEIQKALDLFPKFVSLKKKRYLQRQKFLDKTFGDLARALSLETKKVKQDR